MQRGQPDARTVASREGGFTLIELMMVVLVIAILLAIALPMFLSATNRAKDRATESSLSNALKTARIVYVDQQSYVPVNAATLASAGASLTVVPGNTDPSGQNTVSVYPASDSYIIFAGKSGSGSCFYVADDVSGAGTMYAKLPGAGGCMASGAPLQGDAAWKAKW